MVLLLEKIKFESYFSRENILVLCFQGEIFSIGYNSTNKILWKDIQHNLFLLILYLLATVQEFIDSIPGKY